jgi:hypothetical protein
MRISGWRKLPDWKEHGHIAEAWQSTINKGVFMKLFHGHITLNGKRLDGWFAAYDRKMPDGGTYTEFLKINKWAGPFKRAQAHKLAISRMENDLIRPPDWFLHVDGWQHRKFSNLVDWWQNMKNPLHNVRVEQVGDGYSRVFYTVGTDKEHVRYDLGKYTHAKAITFAIQHMKDKNKTIVGKPFIDLKRMIGKLPAQRVAQIKEAVRRQRLIGHPLSEKQIKDMVISTYQDNVKNAKPDKPSST